MNVTWCNIRPHFHENSSFRTVGCLEAMGDGVNRIEMDVFVGVVYVNLDVIYRRYV